jgi:hypothetical protein
MMRELYFPRLTESANAFPSITAPSLLCSVVRSFYFTLCLRLTGSSQIRSSAAYECREVFHSTFPDNGEISQRLLTDRHVRISEHLLVVCPVCTICSVRFACIRTLSEKFLFWKSFASHFIALFLKFVYLVYDSFSRKSVNQRATFCIVRARVCARVRVLTRVPNSKIFYEILQIVRL